MNNKGYLKVMGESLHLTGSKTYSFFLDQLLKLVEVLYDENSREIARKTTKYIYDSNGNQLKQSTSCTLPDNTQLRPVTNGTAYGDGITDSISAQIEKVSYTYDGFNRLVSAETIKSGKRTIAKYVYNGDDLRESKTVTEGDKTEQTYYTYDRQHVILETDAAGNQKASYIKGINYIAKADSKGNTAFYLYNGHGDVVQMVDTTGEIINQYDYDIWGNPTLTIETAANAIRYAGEFMDTETGMYYLRARYYDPYTGRFVSEDSYWGEDENPLSLNLYTYCANDPVQYTDPSGHYYYVDENGKGHVSEITVSGSTGLNPDIIYDKVIFEGSTILSSNGAQIGSVGGDADAVKKYKSDTDVYAYVSETGSYGTFNFEGNATINNKGNIGTISSSGKSNVTIDNSGNIGGFISTSSGTNKITNASNGSIKTIMTGDNSTTTIENTSLAKIINIITGDSSKTNIVNSGYIQYIHTGQDSRNSIKNEGQIDWLNTGLNNETNTSGKKIGKIDGNGTCYVTLYNPITKETRTYHSNYDLHLIEQAYIDGFKYLTPPEKKGTEKTDEAIEKALLLTGSFEGGGFVNVTGNFDGAGLSVGFFQWNIGQGTLQPMLKEFFDDNPELAKKIFGSNYESVVDMLSSSKSSQMAWARDINNGKRLETEWYNQFVTLCKTTQFEQIQKNAMQEYIDQAYKIANDYNLKTERGLALALDISVQNWDVNNTSRSNIKNKIKNGANEQEVLKLLAQAAVDKANSDFKADVKLRKFTIVNGTGTVHGKYYDINKQYAITDAKYR